MLSRPARPEQAGGVRLVASSSLEAGPNQSSRLWRLRRGEEDRAPIRDRPECQGGQEPRETQGKGQCSQGVAWGEAGDHCPRTEDLPSDKDRVSSKDEVIPDSVDHDAGMGNLKGAGNLQDRRLGSCAGKQADGHVLRGDGPSRRMHLDGGREVLQGGCRQVGGPSQRSGSHEGIQEVGTASRTTPAAVCNVVRDREIDLPSEHGGGAVASHGLGCLLKARRDPQVQEEGLGSPRSCASTTS